jgi:GTP cyclohydrolase I
VIHSSLSTSSIESDDGTISIGHVDRNDSSRISKMADAAAVLLECIGEDVTRDGLIKTPNRMAKALLALTCGYAEDPFVLVNDALFECESKEMVVVKDIDCFSMCEHHMLPFYGKVHIAYLPSEKVIGLSKLARLTNCFARRLQVQERMTMQIAEAVRDTTGALGVAVMTECVHMCMSMRGVEKPGAATVSTSYLGQFTTDPVKKTEFLSYLNRK